jgi:hypothetical protein
VQQPYCETQGDRKNNRLPGQNAPPSRAMDH